MTNHLPECTPRHYEFGYCICDRLRACEQRVTEHSIACRMSEACDDGVPHDVSLDDQRCINCTAGCICGFLRGVAAGLDAAEAAVAAMPYGGGGQANYTPRAFNPHSVVTAIRALKEKP